MFQKYKYLISNNHILNILIEPHYSNAISCLNEIKYEIKLRNIIFTYFSTHSSIILEELEILFLKNDIKYISILTIRNLKNEFDNNIFKINNCYIFLRSIGLLEK